MLWRHVGRAARKPAIQQASCRQGEQCLSGSWGQKNSCTVAVTGSVPGSDLAWQSRLRVHVGCACGVKHTRGWTEQTMPTCASSQASCIDTYRTALLKSIHRLMPPKSYHGKHHAARLQPQCCTVAQHSACEACSPFCSRPRRSESQHSAHPASGARLSGAVIGQFPAILQYWSQAKYVAGTGRTRRASRLRDI